MRQGKYLNVILTVNAVLLSALLWTNLAGSPALSRRAEAAPQQDGGATSGTGIPNAAAQRQKMLEELQSIRASLDNMRKTMEGGKMRIVVANVDELRAAGEASKER